MKFLRASIKTLALIALTLSLCALLITVKVFLPASRKTRWRNFVFRTWARGTARLTGIKINLRGMPPRPPFFLVSNHLGYLDVVVMAACLDCIFIAKRDVESWPLIGFLCRQVDTIFIDRENRRDVVRVNSLIEKALIEGRGVVLFAEGTSTEGRAVAPFNPALLHSAAKSAFPVSYSAVSYRAATGEPPAHLSVCWWGDMTFADHLFRLFQLSSIEATLSFGSEPIVEGDRKLLANELWRAVNEQFIPVVEETCSTQTG
ncbi:MAG TPA: lysophospholipid acyltransferase family protein [Blastocatellia bacterium]